MAYAMLLPTLVLLGVFAYFPLTRLVHMGLWRPNRFGTRETWVGPANFVEVLTGEDFRTGVWISARYVLLTVPIGLLLGLVLALAAHRRLKGIRVFQTVFSSTIASSAAVSAVVFYSLINPKIGRFGDVSWLSLADPDTALRGVALSSIWQNLGLTFVIVLAALQTVPDELLEAAALDGFGSVRRTTKVVLPLISPALAFLGVVLMVSAFQSFAQVELLTGGGPAGSTETLVFKIFERQSPGSISEGAVMSIGMFAITFVMTMVQLTLTSRKVHYGGR
ncbi:MAG: sugar ABC transporter permease [Microthrixaceae bacterium]|nr:sugar ABC transporter permease [Microthrixaceae bacterium]